MIISPADITLDTEEGSLLPETYFFTHGTSRDAMLSRMQEKLDMTLAEAWVNRAPDLPYKTPGDAVILASIIELETADSEDRREVAGVLSTACGAECACSRIRPFSMASMEGTGVKSGVPT